MNDLGCDVREADAGDAERIGALLHAIWDEAGPDAPGFAGATAELIDELAQPEAVRARLGGPARWMVVAVRDDDVVGFAATRRRSDDDVELAGIVVRRAWAGRGVGKDLVRVALDVARREGFSTVIVRTELDNDRAIGFYESLGFVRQRTDVETVGDVHVDVVELAQAL